jgi:hypothetical protein
VYLNPLHALPAGFYAPDNYLVIYYTPFVNNSRERGRKSKFRPGKLFCASTTFPDGTTHAPSREYQAHHCASVSKLNGVDGPNTFMVSSIPENQQFHNQENPDVFPSKT